MRKPILVAAITAALLAVTGTPGHAAAGHDTVNGSGALGQFGDPKVHVAAAQLHGGPIGAYAITYPDGSYVAGTVSCVAVSGNRAYATGRIVIFGGPRVAQNRWAAGSYLIIGVEDNGSPGTAGPDRLNFSPGFASNPGCGPHDDALPVFDIVRGNYHVVDA